MATDITREEHYEVTNLRLHLEAYEAMLAAEKTKQAAAEAAANPAPTRAQKVQAGFTNFATSVVAVLNPLNWFRAIRNAVNIVVAAARSRFTTNNVAVVPAVTATVTDEAKEGAAIDKAAAEAIENNYIVTKSALAAGTVLAFAYAVSRLDARSMLESAKSVDVRKAATDALSYIPKFGF